MGGCIHLWAFMCLCAHPCHYTCVCMCVHTRGGVSVSPFVHSCAWISAHACERLCVCVCVQRGEERAGKRWGGAQGPGVSLHPTLRRGHWCKSQSVPWGAVGRGEKSLLPDPAAGPCPPAAPPSSSRTGRPLEPSGTPSLGPAAGFSPFLLYKLFKKGALQFPGAARALLGAQGCKPAHFCTVLPATSDALAA